MTSSPWDRENIVFGDNTTSVAISLIFAVLIVGCLFVDNGYYNYLVTDLFGYIDGIYRVYLGQIPSRDFHSQVQAIHLLLPAYFMSFGFNPITSIRCYHAVALLTALCVILYAQRTRLDNIVSLFFGALVALALACKENFGDSPFLVTEGMLYNRFCVVFLTLALVLFVPSRNKRDSFSIIDGAIIGILCSIVFYIKVSAGLAGIAFIFVKLFSDDFDWRQKSYSFVASTFVFSMILFTIEFIYGSHFAWLGDIRMAMLSSADGIPLLRQFLSRFVLNAQEIAIAIFIPLIVMWLSGLRLRVYWILYAGSVAFFSVVLITTSAQLSVLFLPLAFLFFALSKLTYSKELSGDPADPYAFAVRLLLLFAIATTAYPLLINIVYASSHYARGLRLQGESSLLSSIRTKEPAGGEAMNIMSAKSVKLIESIPAVEAFSIARGSKVRGVWDNLSFPEYAFYSSEGMKAANVGCRKGARIATFDFVNPFPALLDWPEGGGMLFVAPDYLISKGHHPSENEMLRGIDCILIPKMPVLPAAKQFWLEVYGPFTQANFKKTFESDLWTVMTGNAVQSNATNRD